MTATAAAGERYYRHPGDLLRLITWAIVATVLVVFIEVSDATSAGVATDLGRAAARVPEVVRELFLALTQVAAIAVPVVLVVALLWRRRFRRLGMLLLGGAAGATAFVVVDALIDVPGRLADAVSTDTWVASSRFPSLVYVAGVAAATLVGKPWLSRQWRRATDVTLVVLAAAMAVAGTATPAALLLAVAVGFVAGAALLVAVGAPNRRPSAGSVERGLRSAGVEAASLTLVRADGGRAELYEAAMADGKRLFVKVYDQDSRDADLLFRAYRAALFRGPNEAWPDRSLRAAVEHEALALVMAAKARVRVPALEVVTTLPDRSMVLAMECLAGTPLGDAPEATIDDATLDAVWRQVDLLHDGHIAHRALNESNVMLHAGDASVVDFAASETSAPDLLLAIDRAELLAALTCRVGAERAVASAARVLRKDRLAAAMPYLQPLALSASTRKQTSKATLKQLETATAQATGQEPPPIAQLMRVRPRTLLTTVALAAAFYVLLPQLAHVGGSVEALRTANYGWVAVAVVMSACTYLASAVNLAGAIPHHLPLVPNVETQLAGSFVNRLTPANVGGIALNLRFLQKAGVDTTEAVPGLGLHVASGGVAHAVLLVVFFAWAGQHGIGFKLPDSSKLLVAIAVVLAVAGAVAATRRGRRLVREHVVTFLKEAGASLAKLARWPAKLVMLFGGAFAISLSYICALAAVAFAYHAPVSFAQVGAVFLGASIIAAAAPTPGGLGAMEAALVAGFTGVGVDSAVAVAVVLSYRLLTYWLPVVPGWLSFRSLEHRNLI